MKNSSHRISNFLIHMENTSEFLQTSFFWRNFLTVTPSPALTAEKKTLVLGVNSSSGGSASSSIFDCLNFSRRSRLSRRRCSRCNFRLEESDIVHNFVV